jgi:hypothetical protein
MTSYFIDPSFLLGSGKADPAGNIIKYRPKDLKRSADEKHRRERFRSLPKENRFLRGEREFLPLFSLRIGTNECYDGSIPRAPQEWKRNRSAEGRNSHNAMKAGFCPEAYSAKLIQAEYGLCGQIYQYGMDLWKKQMGIQRNNRTERMIPQ